LTYLFFLLLILPFLFLSPLPLFLFNMLLEGELLRKVIFVEDPADHELWIVLDVLNQDVHELIDKQLYIVQEIILLLGRG
jgi:hypothetical protein